MLKRPRTLIERFCGLYNFRQLWLEAQREPKARTASQTSTLNTAWQKIIRSRLCLSSLIRFKIIVFHLILMLCSFLLFVDVLIWLGLFVLFFIISRWEEKEINFSWSNCKCLTAKLRALATPKTQRHRVSCGSSRTQWMPHIPGKHEDPITTHLDTNSAQTAGRWQYRVNFLLTSMSKTISLLKLELRTLADTSARSLKYHHLLQGPSSLQSHRKQSQDICTRPWENYICGHPSNVTIQTCSTISKLLLL